MKQLYLLTFISLINISQAQWEYRSDDKKNEIISVNDKDKNSSFLIERKNNGQISFFINGVAESECKIETIEFRFDGIKDVLLFKVEKVEEKKTKNFI